MDSSICRIEMHYYGLLLSMIWDKKKNYIIYCASTPGEDAAVRLLSMGLNVVAFLDNALEKQHKQLLGRTIYSYQECREKYPEAIFIIASENWGTAYEIGLELEGDGYRYNDTYFILHELIMGQKLPDSMDSWKLYLKDKQIVLIGEKYLCEIFQYNFHFGRLIICELTEIEEIHTRYPEAFWVILTRGYHDYDTDELMDYSCLLQKNGIKKYTGYFSRYYKYYIEDQFHLSNTQLSKTETLNAYHIDKILFLKMSSFSGSTLINSIMEEHPNVLYTDFSFWSANIWIIVKKASRIEPVHIVDHIIDLIIEYHKKGIPTDSTWTNRYKSILKKYFTQKEYSEKEIFLYLHLAYYEYVNGTPPSPGNYVIYMDVHSGERLCDMILSWLRGQRFQVIMIEIIRRPYMRLGSAIRFTIRDGMELPQSMILESLTMMSMETVTNVERQLTIVRFRFEDMKLYPSDILKRLCSILEIPWDNSLIQKAEDNSTGSYRLSGNIIKGFDTRPVYYSYDEYFDYFDKFRLDMIFREKNKAYDYSYVEKEKYPTGLAENIESLFEIPFQFERYMKFHSEDEKIKFRKKLAVLCVHLFDMQLQKSVYPDYYNFGEYILPETKS